MRAGACMLAAALLAGVLLLVGDEAVAQPREVPRWNDPVGPTAARDEWLRRLVGRYRFEGLIHAVSMGPESCGALPPDPAQSENPPPPPPEYCKPIRGMADCIAIGTGPGVQCVLNVMWDDLHQVVYPTADAPPPGEGYPPTGVFTLPGGVSYLNPAMAMFGLDGDGSSLSYLLVDNKGLPEGGPGSIAGNRATFRTSCVNAATIFNTMIPTEQYRSCDRIIRIDAKPDARVLFMSIDVEINEEVWTRYEMTLRRVTVPGLR